MSGFDFLSCDPDSRKYFTLITPIGAYTMNGAAQGYLNTSAVFQQRICTEILEPARLFMTKTTGCVQWLNDSLLFSNDVEKFINKLDDLLAAFIYKKVRLTVLKSKIVTQTIELHT